MSVVGMNNGRSVTARRTGSVSDRLNLSYKQRNENDVEPHSGQHQRPQRNFPLARFYGGRKAEVPSDHGRRPFNLG